MHLRTAIVAPALVALSLFSIAASSAGDGKSSSPHVCTAACVHDTGMFTGVKANTGHVTHTTENGKTVLTLSDDFKVPETPAPHWQVVDSKGNVYLLQRLMVKGDKLN